MPPKTESSTLSRAEAIELRFKELQIEEMEEASRARQERKDRAKADRERQYQDFQKAEQVRKHRQLICKHRKGGRNNMFWNGNSNDYSINKNIYPTGREVIMCTRCGKEVEKPDRELKKTNPELFASMMREWREWSALPTDNTPSGSKIFEIVKDAAA